MSLTGHFRRTACALLACATAFQSMEGAEAAIRRDIPYGSDPQQKLDIYTPDAGTPRPDTYIKETGRPIVVWIHGGGWAAGDKTDTIGPKSQACCDRGYVFVSVNYRLFYRPEAPSASEKPAITIRDIEQDLAKAVRWLHENARDFGGDPNFLYVTGHSAGAQLAALLCTDETYLKAEGFSLSLIKGCMPVDGDTYYPAVQIDTSTPREASGKRPMFPDDATSRDLSSVVHVAPGKDIPPFLLLHVAGFPETRTKLQSEILAQTLRNAGIEATLFAAEGKTHLTISSDLGRPGEPITKAMLDFLDEQVWRSDYAAWGRPIHDR